MILTADYAGIKMNATSDVERSKRVHPLKAEPETVEWIESLPRGNFFDIGANVGSYAFVAAANGHKVYAFEPPGPTFDRLEENVNLNLPLQVFCFPVLLGDEEKTVRFSFSSKEPGAALHKLGWGPRSEAMKMTRLDDFIPKKHLPWPDYIKLDVDGSELRVLIGAQEALSHTKSLQVEIDPGVPASEHVRDFLFERGFALTKETRHERSGVINTRFDRYEEV